MNLSELRPAPGAVKKRKRIGRGPGSGQGKTAGKGHKGRSARSGGNTPPGYEGGQMPLQRRLPKRGFRSLNRRAFLVVNLESLEERFQPGDTVDPASLYEKGLVSKRSVDIKILGTGKLSKKLTVKAHRFSQTARDGIAAAGGTMEDLKSA